METSGWHVVLNGIADINLELADDGRTVKLALMCTDGRIEQKAVHIPTMLYRGVWVRGQEYGQGDVVTWDGSTFHCNATTTSSEPGLPGADWQLTVRKGRDRGKTV
jgi:hypothetical protein